MLERSTNVAWKTVPGFYFIDRKRSAASVRDHVSSRKYDAVINMGRLDVDFSRSIGTLFNSTDTIRAVSSPRALRRTLADFLPHERDDVAHWHKTGGFGGSGALFHPNACNGGYKGDTQEHLTGKEYRIVTVGESVVQASLKGARRTKHNGRNDFAYTWVGVQSIKKTGIIPLLKGAVGKVPGGDRSVFGWDVLLTKGDGPFVLECNTAPGVNDATAKRIITKVRELA